MGWLENVVALCFGGIKNPVCRRLLLSVIQPVALLLLFTPQAMEQAIAQPNSVFTVNIGSGIHSGQLVREPNHASYDVAVVRFKDDGNFLDIAELSAATQAVKQARDNLNGAIVVLFIHGWHHNAAWEISSDSGDSHFAAFRRMLAFLALREAERYFVFPGGRRVIGIYVGWNGDPEDSWLARGGVLTHLSFWNRYATARQIGDSDSILRLVRGIVQATKQSRPVEERKGRAEVDSPLILIGHSMGALMLQSAFLTLIKDPSEPLVVPSEGEPRVVETLRNGQRIRFPDVLVSLNSAADSVIHQEIREALQARRFAKKVGDSQIAYAGPLLISATSSADNDTRVVWRGANLLHPGRTTDGHDGALFTHRLVREREGIACQGLAAPDFGQNWHCLRLPEPPNVPTPNFALDLPTRERASKSDIPPFARYRLLPMQDIHKPQLTWVFQVPPDVMSDHNDIFNSRAFSLTVALIQVSGAIMSLAQDWRTTFEGPAN